MNPLISVIIPTHNRAYVLERAIQSVLSQDYHLFELIIVDDGSEDETDELLKKYQDHEKVQTFKTSNQGVSHARNFGVSHAKGEWVSFLDSDDEWLKHKLSSQINLLHEQPELKIIHGEEIWIRDGVRVNQMKKHKKFGGKIFDRCLDLCLISPSAVMIEKRLYKELGGFNEDFIVCEDYELWLKITASQEVGFVMEPIIKKYGGHDDQLSHRYRAMDYYRVKAIDYVLKNKIAPLNHREKAIKVLLKKSKILLKGYIKYQNMDHYDEVLAISQKY